MGLRAGDFIGAHFDPFDDGMRGGCTSPHSPYLQTSVEKEEEEQEKSLLPSELTDNTEGWANNPRLLTYEIPGVNGVASAKGLARIWSIVANGGVDVAAGKRFMSSETVNQLFTAKSDRLVMEIQ